MTALIVNEGLGLFNPSYVGGQASIGQGDIKNYVNAATGNLVLNDRDEILVGRGVDIVAEQTYNSLGEWNDSDQNGWRFGFERTVKLVGSLNSSGSSIIRTLGDGHEVTYAYIGSGQYESRNGEGNFDRIWKSGANYIWKNQSSGASDTYNSAGYLIFRRIKTATPVVTVIAESSSLKSNLAITKRCCLITIAVVMVVVN
ncbi:DUF6531 domain-containing protein [Psychromonas sp. MME2]|uniref:DUF6531 domain-containing protein n=1 Tax=Psychromonas sp. MME2 TaxID=3231033 RepID=UPI00339CD1A6